MKRIVQFQIDSESKTLAASRIWEYDGLQFRTWSGVIAYLRLTLGATQGVSDVTD